MNVTAGRASLHLQSARPVQEVIGPPLPCPGSFSAPWCPRALAWVAFFNPELSYVAVKGLSTIPTPSTLSGS